MRVLIADDNPLARRGIPRLLSGDKDLQVCGEASDSNETLQKAGELEPDLVLLDVSMPGMNGLDTARLLRESESQQSKSLVRTFGNRYWPAKGQTTLK